MKKLIALWPLIAGAVFAQDDLAVIEQHTQLMAQPVPVYTKAASGYFVSQALLNIPRPPAVTGNDSQAAVVVQLDMSSVDKPEPDMPETKEKFRVLCNRVISADIDQSLPRQPVGAAFSAVVQSDVDERERYWRTYASGDGEGRAEIYQQAQQLAPAHERPVVDFEGIEQDRPELLRGLILTACRNPRIMESFL